MFRTSAISFVIAMIFSSIIDTSFLGKGYHLSGGFGRWGEGLFSFSSGIAFLYKVNFFLNDGQERVGVDLPAKPLS